MKGLLADPRRRVLAILGVLTLTFVVLAIVALSENAQETAPKYQPHPFFPYLKNQLAELAAIRVESKSSKFTIRFDKLKGWIVVEKGGFPADETQVRQTAVAMAGLEAVEPKTSDPQMLGYAGLIAPNRGGDAVAVTLYGGGNRVLAALLLGKSDDTTDAEGRTGIYVRAPRDNQAWLARGYLAAKPDIGDWLDKRVLTIPRERIKETVVTPLQGEAYTVSREKKEDADFKLAELPAGRELIYDSAPDGVGAAIVGFTFDDIQPADHFDFTRASRTNTTTFDGLTIAVKVIQQGQDYWTTVLAAGATPQTQTEAEAIDARTGGWAYKLPDYKAKLFLTSLDSLLKPAGGQPQTPASPDDQQ